MSTASTATVVPDDDKRAWDADAFRAHWYVFLVCFIFFVLYYLLFFAELKRLRAEHWYKGPGWPLAQLCDVNGLDYHHNVQQWQGLKTHLRLRGKRHIFPLKSIGFFFFFNSYSTNVLTGTVTTTMMLLPTYVSRFFFLKKNSTTYVLSGTTTRDTTSLRALTRGWFLMS